jgi:hypothetical protein
MTIVVLEVSFAHHPGPLHDRCSYNAFGMFGPREARHNCLYKKFFTTTYKFIYFLFQMQCTLMPSILASITSMCGSDTYPVIQCHGNDGQGGMTFEMFIKCHKSPSTISEKFMYLFIFKLIVLDYTIRLKSIVLPSCYM